MSTSHPTLSFARTKQARPDRHHSLCTPLSSAQIPVALPSPLHLPCPTLSFRPPHPHPPPTKANKQTKQAGLHQCIKLSILAIPIPSNLISSHLISRLPSDRLSVCLSVDVPFPSFRHCFLPFCFILFSYVMLFSVLCYDCVGVHIHIRMGFMYKGGRRGWLVGWTSMVGR